MERSGKRRNEREKGKERCRDGGKSGRARMDEGKGTSREKRNRSEEEDEKKEG